MPALGGNVHILQTLAGGKTNVGACQCPVTFNLSLSIHVVAREHQPNGNRNSPSASPAFSWTHFPITENITVIKSDPNICSTARRKKQSCSEQPPSLVPTLLWSLSNDLISWQDIAGRTPSSKNEEERDKKVSLFASFPLLSSPHSEKALKLFSSDLIMQILILLSL